MDGSQAVAPQFQRIGEQADAVFAYVESVLAEVLLGRVAVRHDHFADRRAIEDGALAAGVVVADVVEHQPFAGSETDAELPLLPGDLVTGDSEAGPLGLYDLQRTETIAEFLLVTAVPVAALGRERNDAVIFNPHHFELVQIDDGDDAVKGPRVAVIGQRFRSDPAHSARGVAVPFLPAPARSHRYRPTRDRP